MLKKSMIIGLATSMLMLVFAALSFAQETTGNIVGTTKDANGAAISGATIRVDDPAKKVTVRTVTSNGDGDFTVPNLPAGVYNVTIEASGFKKIVQNGVKVDVGQRRAVDAALEAGNVSEVVTVEADAIGLETGTPQASTTINGDQVRELSINNRNWATLVTLAPGVTNDNDDFLGTGTNNPDTQVVVRQLVSVNGARPTQNTFTVDGADVTDRGSNL
ncbi:MAG: carboxypeptidase regulatory-like domain-containing protein, partial [Acidobacteria bacterium]|nr:carboxypeptidase regulatory-like domain-containing protein [Acidobacteriota bacterium]